MGGQEFLSHYQAIGRISEQMLHAARQSQWDELVQLEMAQAKLLREVHATGVQSLPGAPGDELAELIRRILMLNAETKALAEARRDELGGLLNNATNERKVRGAYGSD